MLGKSSRHFSEFPALELVPGGQLGSFCGFTDVKIETHFRTTVPFFVSILLGKCWHSLSGLFHHVGSGKLANTYGNPALFPIHKNELYICGDFFCISVDLLFANTSNLDAYLGKLPLLLRGKP